MGKVAVLQKVLQVREQEKSLAQKKKNEATALFEKRARALYDLLRKKEDGEKLLSQYMRTYTSIEQIKEQSVFIQSMSQKASSLQESVSEAREEMHVKQLQLTEAYIETKKIEKLIEQKEEAIQEELHRQENMLMDELSIRQFTALMQNR